ncbi:hypothetical protein QAD02_021781 [Eretmocerus hayati]|uniref:Uncharacterized protein n=1 Tax=Eretmocerus hayati TaxID=131215 RepID=A0ACC2PR68_9HYME|nr:hypothetical protein QAD02_021781 [Eretmocerus hayati]
MTKDKSDDNSNDKTDNGNGQSGSGETQTQKVDSTLKDGITSQIESSVKYLGGSLLVQLKDTFAEQFRAALAEKSLPTIDNQTSGVVVNQRNKLGIGLDYLQQLGKLLDGTRGNFRENSVMTF